MALVQTCSDGSGAVEFILANVGRGPAFDVKFIFECDEIDFKSHNVYLRNDPERMPISVLPQGDKVKALFGIGFHLYCGVNNKNIGPLKPFVVRIEYLNTFGIKHYKEMTIDIRQFAGMRGIIRKSEERQIVEYLKKIEKNISIIARESSKFASFVNIAKFDD